MDEKKSTKKPGKVITNPLLMELAKGFADKALQIMLHDMKTAGDVTTAHTRTVIHAGLTAAFLTGFNLASVKGE